MANAFNRTYNKVMDQLKVKLSPNNKKKQTLTPEHVPNAETQPTPKPQPTVTFHWLDEHDKKLAEFKKDLPPEYSDEEQTVTALLMVLLVAITGTIPPVIQVVHPNYNGIADMNSGGGSSYTGAPIDTKFESLQRDPHGSINRALERGLVQFALDNVKEISKFSHNPEHLNKMATLLHNSIYALQQKEFNQECKAETKEYLLERAAAVQQQNDLIAAATRLNQTPRPAPPQ